MTTVTFDKVQGAENDFIVVVAPFPADIDRLAPRLCHRRAGIGADGLLLLEQSDAGWTVAVINADGSSAEISGNGTRCAARFLMDHGLADGPEFQLGTGAGVVSVRVVGEEIAVAMGSPCLATPSLPAGDGELPIRLSFGAAGRTLTGTAISMGNPHLVVEVHEDPEDFPLRQVGATVQDGAAAGFSEGVNLEVVQLLEPQRVKARVWERGVGETRSCGSGACAIGAALILAGEAGSPLTISMPGGRLTVTWEAPPEGTIWLQGPATRVFTGSYIL